ncbi:hypothetical protein CDV36_016486 [Fusarium kuroshium]|uniref:Uncharacterized protein n=1 Tax=Fusarium kuroshium TaxID=2010991 RepID=A0A3M2QMN4_9HYPO|nr:hypothetical protein CDV36_016486 [Fusarium kuroshium]
MLALSLIGLACPGDPEDIGLRASPACKDGADEDVVGAGRARPDNADGNAAGTAPTCADDADDCKSSSYR